MKYTNYLINGNYIDIESMQTENKYFKYPVTFFSIIAALTGVLIILGVLPLAVIADEYRNTKYHYIYLRRKGLNHYYNKFKSLV